MCVAACQNTLLDKDVLNSSTKADIYITNRIKCQDISSKMWCNIFITSVAIVTRYIVIVKVLTLLCFFQSLIRRRHQFPHNLIIFLIHAESGCVRVAAAAEVASHGVGDR